VSCAAEVFGYRAFDGLHDDGGEVAISGFWDE
jgi:hypothetical protein